MRCNSVRITRLLPRRHIQVNQFFNRHHVSKVIAHRVHIIKAVAHHGSLGISLGFHVLLNTCMQKTDIRNAIDDGFAIELEQEAQDAMRGRMLRAHVQEHGFAGQRAF
jgi:hypothetical protein